MKKIIVLVLILGCFFLFWSLSQSKRPVSSFASEPTPAAVETRTPESLYGDRVEDQDSALPIYGEWENFTTADGLPSNKVFCIRSDGPVTWAGTDNGLARYENGQWKTWGVREGLPHRAVLSLDVSPHTGDLWIGTMGGLARYSAGRIDAYNQLSSGLSNDFVNEVQCDPEEPYLWVATAMGLSRLHVPSGTWDTYTHENTPMHEPWTYSVAVDRGMVYVGAWGAGILEYSKAQGRWREYRDPDKEMELDLLPNDGPVHDVTSAIDFSSGILWQASYMGLARYDGRAWSSYYKEDSGLASNFVNFIRARGRLAWMCTDDGLAVSDGERWATYRKNSTRGGQVILRNGREVYTTQQSSSAFVHNFILGADLNGEEIWLATEGGASKGRLVGQWPEGQEVKLD